MQKLVEIVKLSSYTIQNEKVPRFPFVVSLSNHDGNRPFDKLRANGFRSKIQFCWLYFIKMLSMVGTS
ncbi:hypothetical protein [Moraxella lacunata]|uniref:hypothetical protein n=1 Tax=Moraxella lacunata TaxID=477 RepID=UPI003EE01C91